MVPPRLFLACLLVSILAPLAAGGLPLDGTGPVEDEVDATVDALRPQEDSNLGHEAKVSAPESQVEAYFGRSVAIDGDTLAVGSGEVDVPYDGWGDSEGAVYIYHRAPNGWEFQERILAPDHLENRTGSFGITLDLHDGRLVVGDPDMWVGGTSLAGAVYFFENTSAGWSFEEKFTGVDLGQDDDPLYPGKVAPEVGYQLGRAVSIADDTAFVQAFGAHTDPPRRTHIIAHVNGSWEPVQLIHDSSTGGAGELAVDGDTALVGDINDNEVHVYSQETESRWVRTDTLTVKDPDRFGAGLDLNGNYALVGEFWTAEAHVFQRTPQGWSHQQELTGPRGTSHYYGLTVALSETRAFVGAYGEENIGWRLFDVGPLKLNDHGRVDAGAVYVFNRSSDGIADRNEWDYSGRFTANDIAKDDQFGISLDASEGSLAVGSSADDLGNGSGPLGLRGETGEGDQGSAYVYSNDTDGDDLADEAEGWLGLEVRDPDTDGDRVDDGTEHTCGWDPGDPSSPVAAGGYTASDGTPPVPVAGYRWFLCGLIRS